MHASQAVKRSTPYTGVMLNRYNVLFDDLVSTLKCTIDFLSSVSVVWLSHVLLTYSVFVSWWQRAYIGAKVLCVPVSIVNLWLWTINNINYNYKNNFVERKCLENAQSVNKQRNWTIHEKDISSLNKLYFLYSYKFYEIFMTGWYPHFGTVLSLRLLESWLLF